MPADAIYPRDRADDADLPSRGSVLQELLTARQLAKLLQMPPSTIENYARRGLLPSLKLGRHRRFVRSQVEHAISQLVGDAK